MNCCPYTSPIKLFSYLCGGITYCYSYYISIIAIDISGGRHHTAAGRRHNPTKRAWVADTPPSPIIYYHILNIIILYSQLPFDSSYPLLDEMFVTIG